MADDRFYVKSLRMQNFRCFEDVELGPFDPHFNLIIGENGAGKSSVLVALADLFFKIGLPNRHLSGGRLISFDDVRLEHFVSGDGVTTVRRLANVKLSGQAVSGQVDFVAQDELNAGLAPPRLLPRLIKVDEATKLVTDFTPARNINDDLVDAPAPLIAFYRTGRLFASPPNEMHLFRATANLRDNAFENWTDAGVSSEALSNWIKTQTLAALQQEQRSRAAENSGGNSTEYVRQIAFVVRSVTQALEGAELVDFDADLDDIVVQFRDGQRRDFLKMSDGQRALIGLVADIARRAAVLNAFYFGKKTLEETTGLVLIDEIDLHLHPKWQRQIVPALKKIFPKIQFFATTHSPQVIGECKPEEIVLLTPQGQKKYVPGSYGMDSNWILECVMGAEGRNPEIAKRIKSLFDLIDSDRLEEAKSEIRKLREELPDVAPDIIAAESYIWNLEHTGDEAAE